MWSQILVLAAVVALFVSWLRGARGREALALLGKAPEVLLVPPLLWGLVWVLGEVAPRMLDTTLFTLPGTSMPVSGGLLILIAVGLLASAHVVARLARAAGAHEARWTQLFPGLALGQVAVWVPTIALVQFLPLFDDASPGAFYAIVGLLALWLVLLNVCLARLVARLVESEGKLGPAFARVWRRDPTRDRPVLGPVLIRLLMTGAITLIVMLEDTTWWPAHSARRSSYQAHVDVQTVATITYQNPWPQKLAASLHYEREAPQAHQRGAGLLSAFVSLVFLAAFVRGTRRPQVKWPF